MTETPQIRRADSWLIVIGFLMAMALGTPGAQPEMSVTEPIYKLHPGWDYPLLGLGLIGAGAAFAWEWDMAGKKIDPADFRRSEIPPFDRWVIGSFSAGLSRTSDVLILGEGLLPVGLTALDFGRKAESFSEAWRDAVLYGEVVTAASMVSIGAKILRMHPRPLVFTDAAPNSERTSGDARSSFMSEHTTGAFAAAVFGAYTFQLRHPNSPALPYLWGGALGLATAVGALRVASGKHFPSDVLAGALCGGLIGYAVPRLHLVNPERGEMPGRTDESDATNPGQNFWNRLSFALFPGADGVTPMLRISLVLP